MDRLDEYRRNAKLCQDMANSTRNENDRRQWLELADSWLRMLRPAKRTQAEAFDLDVREKGTGQP
jgi:hypothetical protein